MSEEPRFVPLLDENDAWSVRDDGVHVAGFGRGRDAELRAIEWAAYMNARAQQAADANK